MKRFVTASFQFRRLATSTYCVEGRLKIEQSDTIAVVDGRPELSFIKGQNQRTFEIGTFPRNILEVLRFNRHGTLNTISRPVNGTLQHSAHGAAFGAQWGSPSFLDSSYSGKVQLRQKSAEHVSKSNRQQRTVSEHFAKEKKTSANKQFSYNKLINDQRMHYEQQQHAMKSRPKPERPPAPHVQPQEGILIDLSPEELRSMNHTLQSQAKATKLTASCILDEPIEVPTLATEGYEQHPSEHPLMPPRYTMPPQYLNTGSMTGHDPFDTTHIASIENVYSNAATHTGPEPLYNNNPNRYTPNSMSDPHPLNASLASLSLRVGNQNDNINDRLFTTEKVEKQMLSEQLSEAKEHPTKLNLEPLEAPVVSSTTIRGFDPFSPVQTGQMFLNNNFENTEYANQHASDGSTTLYDSNIYNSVAGDSVYAENFYDAVQSPSAIYESAASVYGAHPPSVYSVQQQQAIYDEVSAYDEMRWQPPIAALRPAPAPPVNSSLLSEQQINRRLEKLNQHGVIVELMNKLSADNMTQTEAKEALNATNWNQDLATRFFKIDRLAK